MDRKSYLKEYSTNFNIIISEEDKLIDNNMFNYI